MRDLAVIREAFDAAGIDYVYHDDRVDDCACGSESLYLDEAEVTFWFKDGKYIESTPY